ncbi:MAG: hypothetical protein U9P38_03700, partial [Campylobacterota bacterium]|nr:hypothetical protein [Campylobacterota bacterium]
MKKTTLSSVVSGVLASILLFSGCSSGDAEIVASYRGKAVDGYIANALVYHQGYKDEGDITDESGEFSLRKRETKIILEPRYDETGNCLTIDITTGFPFTKVLSAPSDYAVVTPLTTVLAETETTIEELAKALDLNISQADKILRLDPVDVMNSDRDALEKEEASKIFTKGVILEKQLEILLSDKNIFDGNSTSELLENKSIMIDAIFNTIEEKDSTEFDTISADELASAYATASVVKNENIDLTSNNARASRTIITQIASKLNDGLEDINYLVPTSGYNLALAIGKGTADLSELTIKLLDVKPTSINSEVEEILDAAAFKAVSIVSNAKAATLMESEGANEDEIQKIQIQAKSARELAQIRLDNSTLIKINPAPTIVDLQTAINLESTDTEYTLSITVEDKDEDGKDSSSTAQYIARISGDIVKFKDNNNNVLITSEDLHLSINGVGSAKVFIVPMDNQNKVGLEQEITFSIKSNETENQKTPLALNVSQESYTFTSTDGVPDVKKIDINLNIIDSDGDGALKDLIVTSANTEVVQVEYSDDLITVFPIYNGDANITVDAVDENNLVTSKKIEITVQDVSLPPILSYKDEKIQIVKIPHEVSSVVFEYIIEDPDEDDVTRLQSIYSNSPTISCEDNSTHISCTVDSDTEKGTYSISAIPFDEGLTGEVESIELTIFEGNVAPELTLIGASSLTMAAMNNVEVLFEVDDLNREDTITVTATSSDETIVTVAVIENKISLISQPKIGTSIISVVASDGELSSATKTFEVSTVNELGSLVPKLKVVPILAEDESLFDGRYKMNSFNSSYNIESNKIIVNGDINGSYFFSNFELSADINLSQFGGSDETQSYGLVVDMDVKREGEDFRARVLGFKLNSEMAPYSWALATEEEICNAGYSEDT